MAQDIASSGAGTNVQEDYSVDAAGTDAGEQKPWRNTNWEKWKGYFDEIPELNSVITAKAVWTVGKGFKADESTTKILNKIIGWEKDNFNNILKNAIMTYQVGGDAFLEIITPNKKEKLKPDGSNLINLKPLDPGTIGIITNKKGMLLKYEQTIEGKKKRFDTEKILHFARNRFADNIHGTSLTEKMVNKILALNESISDYKQVQHRFVKPRWIIKLNTDNTAKIAAEKLKWDKANADGENMYIPMGSVEAEQMSIPEGSSLDPTKWQAALKDSFYEESGVPKIIIGNASGIAEAGVKVVYLAFQQTIEEEQLFIQDQIKAQLGLEIDLEFPVRMEQANKSPQETERKSGNLNKPSDTEASMPGNK